MRRRTFALSTFLALQPMAAEACTFSWRRGQSPAEIRENPDLRRVSGIFRFIEGQGESRHDRRLARSWVLGRIDFPNGRYWNTIQWPLNEFAIECGAYLAPTANGATGTFWIARDRTGGRYRLMLWEGRYVASGPAAVPGR